MCLAVHRKHVISLLVDRLLSVIELLIGTDCRLKVQLMKRVRV
jgi:hypothetical protein